MAASYSSFLTSSFYSPIFNTALFDGPFRFYFSQSYESTALKMYHILQSENKVLWLECKKWSDLSKKNIFILVYPTREDVSIAFDEPTATPIIKVWDEGLAIGLENSNLNETDEKFNLMMSEIVSYLANNFVNLQYEAPIENF
jgi:hypothetical protein